MTKKLIIFGASGRTGQELVKQALAKNYQVLALVHSHNPFQTLNNPNLKVANFSGKTNYFEFINSGKADVISVIGHSKLNDRDSQSQTIQKIIQAMDQAKLKRLISLTGNGVRQPNDKISLIDWLMNTAIRIIDPKRIQDGINHAKIIKNSQTDWTILRVLKLTNSQNNSIVKLGLHGPAKIFVSRAQVARAILELVDQNSFIQQMPIIQK